MFGKNLAAKKDEKSNSNWTILIPAIGFVGLFSLMFFSRNTREKKMKTPEKFKTFNDIAIYIIKNFEGGYYHPRMMAENPEKFKLYVYSGETMFGIDRKTGGTINTTESGKKFWAAIDALNKKQPWSWNFKGGEFSSQLMKLAAAMIQDKFEFYSKSYLSATAQARVKSNIPLLFFFTRTTWSGSGYFKEFSKIVNENLHQNDEEIFLKLIKARLTYNKKSSTSNLLVQKSGKKIAEVFEIDTKKLLS